MATVDIPIPAKDLTGFSILMVNTEGIASVSNTVYGIEVIPDKVPEIELLQPLAEQETVTLKAKPLIEFRVSDDYALKHLALVYIITETASGESGDAEEQHRIEFPVDGKSGPPREESYSWEISTTKPGVKEGQNLTYWIEAEDNNNVTGPGIGRSKRQQFVVVTVQEKRDEIAERVKKQADELNNINKTQKELSDEVKGLIR
ncbi:MAG: DUF4175 domain-containing protein [Blastochloris sp.]|nr:DUF4175 domain-containing protein [Blastochloris sp.]